MGSPLQALGRGRALPSSGGQVKDSGVGGLCRGVLGGAGWFQLRGVFGKLVPWWRDGEGDQETGPLVPLLAGCLCEAPGGPPAV